MLSNAPKPSGIPDIEYPLIVSGTLINDLKYTPAFNDCKYGVFELVAPCIPNVFTTDAFKYIVGLTLSLTVTNCVAVAIFPKTSVAVQVTDVIPTGKLIGALLVIVMVPQPAFVDAVPKLTPCATQPLLVIVVTDEGAVIDTRAVSVAAATVILVVPEQP